MKEFDIGSILIGVKEDVQRHIFDKMDLISVAQQEQIKEGKAKEIFLGLFEIEKEGMTIDDQLNEIIDAGGIGQVLVRQRTLVGSMISVSFQPIYVHTYTEEKIREMNKELDETFFKKGFTKDQF